MMFHSPYFSMPYFNRYSRYGYRYPSYSYNYINHNTTYDNKNFEKKGQEKKTDYRTASINAAKECTETKSETNENNDSPLFQLFGIDLYFDDILLVCLILFLYQEGVKDESLFIALILLLLS